MDDATAKEMVEAINGLRNTVKRVRWTLFWIAVWIFFSMLNSCEIKNRLIDIVAPVTKPAEPAQK